MKQNSLRLFSTAFALVIALVSSNGFAGPSEDVVAAAKKLGQAGGYSWTAKRSGSQFWTGTVEGKVRKDGATLVTNPGFQGDSYQTAFSGEHSAAETQDGWQSAAELANAEGFGRFMGGALRRFKAPADEVQELAKHAESLTLEGGVYQGKLKADGVKQLLSWGGGQGPEVKNPAGSVKIWIKDGQISSYELELKGQMSWDGNDVDLDRKTKVEISKVGETEFEFPAGAVAKLKG